jgi:SAM-dependent methyltransferase
MPERSPQTLVDAHFGRDASFWTDVYSGRGIDAIVYRERRDRALQLVETLGLPRESRILELGCGSGDLSVRLALAGYAVTATDTVEAMRQRTHDRAKVNGLEIQTLYADAHALPFPNGTFDVVVLLGVIPWLHAPRDALTEVARVLGSDGFAIVSADNARRLNEVLDPTLTWLLAPARTARRKLLKRTPTFGDHALPRRHRPRELDGLLVEAGMEPVRAGSTVGFGPVTFFGRSALSERLARALNAHLQAGADRGVPGLRTTGVHYLVLAQKRGAEVTSG